MYGISALSNRHETQHFHRLSRLPLMEHSPTLKLIHTGEVAPGASSAPLSNLSADPLEDERRGQEKQESSASERTNLRLVQGSKDIRDDEALSALIAKYTKEVQGLDERLNWHTTRLVELQQIVDKRASGIKDQPRTPSGSERPPPRKEEDERGASWLTEALLMLLLGVSSFFAGKYQAEASIAEKRYQDLQEERDRAASIPAGSFEDLSVEDKVQTNSAVESVEDKVQTNLTVERIIDGADKAYNGATVVQQSDAMEPDIHLKTPVRSWASLLWKKQ